MKKTKIIRGFVLAFLICCLSGSILAQTEGECEFPEVGKACVGACGNTAVITYVLPGGAAELGKDVDLCVETISSSLCPSHRAIVTITIDGKPVASGDITVIGSTVSVVGTAVAGSRIEARVRIVGLVSGINCKWLGNLDFVLRSSE